MVTLVLTACPAGLRGHLNRWLQEIAPGVFVGELNPRLREHAWALTVEGIKDGRAIMVYSDKNQDQGFGYVVHRHEWELMDLDGLTVIRRPSRKRHDRRRGGWSFAARKRRSS
ncbi:type I-E CRISPR-associated endoribonuclease Cas2e [Corynebacterium spheniscorum]|uniref:CRISPR-associated protein Cas2 n=1 Tax=Corynebacterium spheniscorum TaxID=185761 RepID=A0A1I2QI47_9CORY|nr:type I-E CRISPR-associated endoribonuclease Cas2e [Corynebacterium spheniscorum]KAA8719634.1 type I-E CRISPR-associated endoribonuclease Cas2 [Corynebacterium spheniscorum]SFG25406.1 CRISPR-associated protein Cas2 [Corynebacterium spheniscorum]